MTPEERAHAAADLAGREESGPTRRLSWLRIVGFIAVLAAGSAAMVGFRTASAPTHRAAPISAFLPYVDVTASPTYPFEDAVESTSANLVLGFVVSGGAGSCQPSWGSATSLARAATSMDLDRRIARLRQRGGQVAISFGGAANSELAITCSDPAQLAISYRTVIDRYDVDTIDLDIEGQAASAPDVSTRRAKAVHDAQAAELQAGRALSVWLTLPVDPSGLTASSRGVLASMLAAKVDVAGVNALTMDFGSSLPAGQSLISAGESALTNLARQLASAYAQTGVHLSTAQAWQRIGATPMIGQNDVVAERFGLDDARALLSFAQAHHLRRLSMWSVNRDQSCGPNYANVSVVSDNCSGVDQQPAAFTKILSGFKSGPVSALPSPSMNTPLPAATALTDDPAASPYPIWNPVLPYAQGTKIVWRHNVYAAKWWTRGDTPDAPVATASQTPWTLIGPVLPGEHPKPTPTLSADTYPQWSATTTYVAGKRVIYEGVGYQAKWYTHGDVPGIVVSDPGQTPWALITSS